MDKRKILYFMTDNPMRYKAGNTTRCKKMLDYFSSRSDVFDVDFLTLQPWTEEEIEKFKSIYPTINLDMFRPGSEFSKKDNYTKYFIHEKLPRLIGKKRNAKKLISLVTPFVEKQLLERYADRHYDVLIVSYAYWAELIKLIPATYKINDTHDFLSVQHAPQDSNDFAAVGKMFQEELSLLNPFDEVWSYSVEERFIFDQFLNTKVKLVPLSFEDRTAEGVIAKEYDILYVASDNHHNVTSMNWFMEHVLPSLKNRKVTVVGKICDAIPDHSQITKLGLVEDLDKEYSKARITICPMLSGTGVKIKVLESLSFGIPVVTTMRGVDGLLNKTNNGCLISDNPTEFVDNIELLLNDDKAYQMHRADAVRYFQQHHHPSKELDFLNSSLLQSDSSRR